VFKSPINPISIPNPVYRHLSRDNNNNNNNSMQINSILYLFTSYAQQPVANYGISKNTNNVSNNRKQEKPNKKTKKRNNFSILKPDFLMISVDIQTVFAA
jgi:hypothetical protein